MNRYNTYEDKKCIEPIYWIAPVRSDKEQTAEKCVEILVGKNKIYALSERTKVRKQVKQGDYICFYATTKGIIAHAKVLTKPQKIMHEAIKNTELYEWVFDLGQEKLYIDKPIILDLNMRKKLDAFKGKEMNNSWSWFVQSTHRLSRHDYELLTKEILNEN